MYRAQLLNVINARYFLCKRAVIYFIKEKALSAHEIHIDLYDLYNDKLHVSISIDLPLSFIVFSKIPVISTIMKLYIQRGRIFMFSLGVQN